MPKDARNISIGYARETTRGTKVAVATKFLPWIEFSPDAELDYRKDDSAFGQRESLLRTDVVNHKFATTLGVNLDADLIGELLYHLFGQVTSSASSPAGAYTHTFSNFLNDLQYPTFTLQYPRAEEGDLAARGCAVKKVTIEITEKDCTLKAEIIGLEETAGDSQTVTYTVPNRPLLGKNLTAKYASTIAGLSGGGTAIKIRKLTLEIDNGMDYDPALGSVYHNDTFAKGNVEVKVSFEAVVRSALERSDFLANTQRAWEFDINASNLPNMSTSSLKPRLRVRVPTSTFSVKHSSERGNEIMYTCEIMPQWNSTAQYMIELLLQNTTASYTS
jgi:hypothetical protein